MVYKGTFTFRLEGKPQYITLNVVLPIFFLCILNMLVFCLPSESGERVSYAITVLLSIAVFVTIVSLTLAKTSEPLPLISYLLMISLIISSMIAVITIFNLRLFHKRSDVVVPNWLIRVYRALRWCSCKRRCKQNKVQTDDLNENHNDHVSTEIKLPPLKKMSLVEQGNEKGIHLHGYTMADVTTKMSDDTNDCT